MAHGLATGALLAGLLTGCATLGGDLQRAETAFQAARYEDVEVWLSTLEPELPRMPRPQRARFYYLRGTTAFRLSQWVQARHYLALAREEARLGASVLPSDWRRELARMLSSLPRSQDARDS